MPVSNQQYESEITWITHLKRLFGFRRPIDVLAILLGVGIPMTICGSTVMKHCISRILGVVAIVLLGFVAFSYGQNFAGVFV